MNGHFDDKVDLAVMQFLLGDLHHIHAEFKEWQEGMNVLTLMLLNFLIFANLVAVDAVSLKSYLQFSES